MSVDRDLAAATQAGRVVDLARRVLGAGALGGYRFGSAVLGGLRPTSDLDILVLTSAATTGAQRRALVDGLLEVSPRGEWGPSRRPVDLTVVAAPDVRPWRYPPQSQFQYGEWLRPEFEAGAVPEPGPDPGLALAVHVVRGLGDVLFGPPPAQLLDPVPRGDLVRAMLDGIPGLNEDLAWDTRNVVLTFARIWTTLATGEIRSKDAAADRVLPRLPAEHRAVLARARDIYLGRRERMDEAAAGARPYVDHVTAEIERLLAEGA